MSDMQKDSISIRELQKMNAGAIQALERPILVKSGTTVVGQLKPLRRRTVEEARDISQRYSDWQKSWSDEDWRIAEAILAERSIPNE
jgi:hypothetical protein